MELVASHGNAVDRRTGKDSDPDVVNRVYVYDSLALPFHPAEMYHQFHNGLGHDFGHEYTHVQRSAAEQAGLVLATGCPERRTTHSGWSVWQ